MLGWVVRGVGGGGDEIGDVVVVVVMRMMLLVCEIWIKIFDDFFCWVGFYLDFCSSPKDQIVV